MSGSIEIAKALIPIRADASQFRSDIESAKPGIMSSVNSLSQQILGVFGGIGIASSLSAIWSEFRAVSAEGERATKVSQNLGFMFEQVGGNVGFTVNQLNDWIEKMHQTTGVDTAAMQNAASRMLTFDKIRGEVFFRAMKAAADMQDRFGGVGAASNILAKALSRPESAAGALRKAGIQLSEDQQRQIKHFQKTGESAKAMDLILKQVEKTYGGMSEKKAATPLGQLEVARGLLSDVKEEMGKLMIPFNTFITKVQTAFYTVVLRVGEAISSVVQKVVAWNESLGGLPGRIVMIVSGVLLLFTALQKLWPIITMILGGLKAVAIAMFTNPIGIFIGLVAVAAVAVYELWRAIMQTTEGQKAWEEALMNLKMAWEVMKETASMVIDLIVQAFWSLLGVFGITRGSIDQTKDKMVEFGITGMQKISEFVLDASEWLQVLVKNWGKIWDNLPGIAIVALSYIGDVIANIFLRVIPQLFGYGLRKAFDAFVWLIENLPKLLWELVKIIGGILAAIPKMIYDAATGGDPMKVIKDKMSQATGGFTAGLRGELPRFQDAFVPSEATRRRAKERLGALAMDLQKDKEDLEKKRPQRRADLQKPAEKEEKRAEARIIAEEQADIFGKAFDKKNRMSFSDLGKTIQDALLQGTDPNTPILERQAGLLEHGVKIQEEQLKIARENVPGALD